MGGGGDVGGKGGSPGGLGGDEREGVCARLTRGGWGGGGGGVTSVY